MPVTLSIRPRAFQASTGVSIDLQTIFAQLTRGHDLTRAQARWAFQCIMQGEWAESVIGALLGALMTKGESVDELVGAAEAMRESAVRVRCDAGCIDTCGTGGDGISTFNVSTTAAIIAAAAGATVAKHGNRSTTRASGSTEVLGELGIDTEADVGTVERCLREVGIGYLNARNLHPAMKYAAPVRRAIPTRTIFNLLGPLTNPAGARRQVLGVPRVELVDKMADALGKLGVDHAWVVHGQGLCDLTITGETVVTQVRGESVERFMVTPESVGLTGATLADLEVDSPRASADTIRAILDGRSGPPRDHAVLNAGAALVVAGVAADLSEGVRVAAKAVDDGKAKQTLSRWQSLGGIAAAGVESGSPR